MLNQLPIIQVAAGDGVELTVDDEADFQYLVVSIQNQWFVNRAKLITGPCLLNSGNWPRRYHFPKF